MEVIKGDSFDILEREKNQPIHQWVNRVLRMNIIRLRLRPGQEISETEIADRMGISRTPAREAFIRLAEDGLLEVRPQRRSIVSRIDLEQAEETRFVRRSLEKSITKDACGRFSEDGLSAMLENLKEQERCLTNKDYERFLAIDDEFHRIVYRGCGKERIWEFVKKLDTSYDRLRIMTYPFIGWEIMDEHRVILDLLRGGGSDQVEAAVEGHLTNSVIGRVILEYPRDYFKQDPREYALKIASAVAVSADGRSDH